MADLEEYEQFNNEDEEETAPPTSWLVKLGRALIALIALGALLYLGGIHQYFFFQRTPPAAQQPLLSPKVEAEMMVIPTMIHILAGDRGSDRTVEDVRRLIDNANNIWSQARITFVIQNINHIDATRSDLRHFDRNPHAFIEGHESYNPEVANLYLTRTLGGVNGLAYGGTSAVSVADYTASLDYRTLAHEFGHLLGLGHVDNPRRLMSSGAAGTDLSLEEIAVARNNAQQFTH